LICCFFGLADGFATLLGAHLNIQLQSSQAAWLERGYIVVICGWIIFAFALSRRISLTRGSKQRTALLVLPFVLSLDNLFGGSVRHGTYPGDPSAPLISALTSATFAYFGFEVAKRLRPMIPARLTVLAGLIPLLSVTGLIR